MKIESDTTKTAPKYPTLVKVVTAAATAALLSACDEPAPQRPPGLRLAPAPPPYEPKIEFVPEPADSPLDNPPATPPNID